MPVPAYEMQKDDSLSVVIAEDEENLADLLKDDLEKALAEQDVNVLVVNNTSDLKDLINNNRCDVLLADLFIYENANKRSKQEVKGILVNIIKEEYFIPVIGYTAFDYRRNEVVSGGLVRGAYLKDELKKQKYVIEKIMELVLYKIHYYKEWRFFIESLVSASKEQDPIERQSILELCREKISIINEFGDITKEHKKLIRWMRSFVARLSSVPSLSLGIYGIKGDIEEVIVSLYPMIINNCFHFKQTYPLQSSLEARGYPAMLKIDI